jgi:hypothetical protein
MLEVNGCGRDKVDVKRERRKRPLEKPDLKQKGLGNKNWTAQLPTPPRTA